MKRSTLAKVLVTFILALPIIMVSSKAQAAQNSPETIVFSIIGVLVLAGIFFLYQYNSLKKAENPNDGSSATAGNLSAKLREHIDPRSVYEIQIIRQSGNIERTETGVLGSEVCSRILSSMHRASIGSVSITMERGNIQLRRIVYNGRGRQEGKRIGGYFIRKTGEATKAVDQDVSETEIFQNEDTFEEDLVINAKSPAQQALIKCWFRIAPQFEEGKFPDVELSMTAFDEETGSGTSIFSRTDLMIFLSLIDQYLSGEALITPEILQQLRNSDSPHHVNIATDPTRTAILGIESFDVSPEQIKGAFGRWYKKVPSIISDAFPKPKTLSLRFS